jgi:hypothetical protein
LNPDPAFQVNPDPDTVSGFDQQNLRRKKIQLKNKFFFFRSKIAIYFPEAFIKDVQATGEAFSPQKRTPSTFLWVIFALLYPDPDPQDCQEH